jgi:hypothetical protein
MKLLLIVDESGTVLYQPEHYDIASFEHGKLRRAPHKVRKAQYH